MSPFGRPGAAAGKGPVRRHLGTLVLSLVAGLLAAVAVNAGVHAWNAAHAPQDPPLGVQEGSPVPAPAPPATRGATRPWRSPLRPVEGADLLQLAIPKLGERWTVVEGVELADIRSHPGHYPGSALPGEVGNFAVAGHRLPGLFWDLDQLHVGDRVVVRAAGRVFTYRVYDREVVPPTAVYVVSPDPEHPGRPASRALLTLTTCLKTGHQAREIVHAVLESKGAL